MRSIVFPIVLAIGAGCSQQREALTAPNIEVEKDLKPGMSQVQVEGLLGKPDENYLSDMYSPPVIRIWEYQKLQMKLTFHEERGLGEVEIRERWTKPVLGIRVGDDINNTVHEKPNEQDNRLKLKSDIWPDVEARSGGFGDIRIISVIQFTDRRVIGDWDVKVRSR